MKENILKDRSFQFSLAVIKVYKQVSVEHKEYVLTKQLLRSGTAIGALYREAEHAQSKIDFIHKLSIALKEANETLYWIELLHQSAYLTDDVFTTLQEICLELIKLLVAIIKTTKASVASNK